MVILVGAAQSIRILILSPEITTNHSMYASSDLGFRFLGRSRFHGRWEVRLLCRLERSPPWMLSMLRFNKYAELRWIGTCMNRASEISSARCPTESCCGRRGVHKFGDVRGALPQWFRFARRLSPKEICFLTIRLYLFSEHQLSTCHPPPQPSQPIPTELKSA